MAQILSISINLSKIDKSKLIEGKTGDKYLNLNVSINDEKDQFGNDCGVYISQSKEERESKIPKQYLGNGKIIWQSDPKPKAQEPETNFNEEEHDDLPF